MPKLISIPLNMKKELKADIKESLGSDEGYLVLLLK